VNTTEPVESGLCLRVLEGTHNQELHALTRSVVSIGRATPENPYSPSYLTFPEPTLSRLHAVLTWEPGAKAFMVHHRSQTNPTLLNGRNLKKSKILKVGDILALGRLAVKLEKSTALKMEMGTAIEAPAQVEELCLHLSREDHDGSPRSFSVSKPTILLNFQPQADRIEFGSPQDPGTEHVVTLPASEPGSVRLQVDRALNTAVVENHQQVSLSLVRRTLLGWGHLEVPVRSAPCPLTARDLLVHQGYQFWLARQGAENPGSSTLGGKPTGEAKIEEPPVVRARLHFLNGAWTGAEISVFDGSAAVIVLGPNSKSLYHPSPLAHAPTCQISVGGGKAQLRVSQVSDDQFVDVNGELLFTGESCELFSGSKLLLGEYELVWLVPDLHRVYTRYRVLGPDGEHPIEKAEVRIGTAAHCEIRLNEPALAPVVGTLRYQNSGFTYLHRNIAIPARVDDKETSEGLIQAVQSGSVLELAPGVSVTLKEIDC
jgi:pSer/pThr/pTyr-binding forkhead associated (FHA) protein